MALEGRTKGEKTKEGEVGREAGVFVVSTRAVKNRSREKWQEAMDSFRTFRFRTSRTCESCSIDTIESSCGTAVDGRAGKRYLQSGSVHVSRQFSSPSTGYHEHFIGVHLQRETRVSAHVTPACWCELSVNTSFSKHDKKKILGIFFLFFFCFLQYCLWQREHWVGEQVRDREWGVFCRFWRGGAKCRVLHCAHFFWWRHVQ